MDVERFQELKARIEAKGLVESSIAAGALTVLVEVALSAGLLLALALRPPPWAWLAAELAGGVVLFRWFAILHEAGHRTLFPSRAANAVAGHLASAFCLIPFIPWREVHALHHRWVGVIDKDPTQAPMLKLQQAGRGQALGFRIVWALWLPIPFARFLFDTYWLYPLERRRAGDGRAALAGLVSAAVALLPHLALIALVGPGRWAAGFLPMYAVFLVLIENMNLPQHAELFPHLSSDHPQPLPPRAQDAITRSSHLPDLVGTLLALNFNRHTEHHLFPRAPWWALNRVRRELLAAGYAHPHEEPFLGFMLKARRRDPFAIYRDSLPEPYNRPIGEAN